VIIICPHRLALSLSLLLLAGCTVGPDFRKPDPVLPDRWSAARDPDAQLKRADETVLGLWWKSFNDPELDRLIEDARAQNFDLRIAMTKIDQARSEQNANRAALFPRIGAVGDVARISNLLPFTLPRGNNFNYFLSGFDAIWEIDLFGRLHRKLEAARAQTAASAEESREAFVILSAEIGRQYLTYCGLQQEALLLENTLKLLKQNVLLAEHRIENGLAPKDEAEQVRALVESTQSELRSVESELSTTRHKLEELIGRKPDALKVRLASSRTVPKSDERRLLTQPADALRLRPDIRSAEFELESATATQGAAIAELFPKISIAAFLGLRNSDLENLFRSSSFAWATAASVSQPIFNFGQIRAGINLAEARQNEAYLQYEKTVLAALHETEVALSEFLKEEQRTGHLKKSVAHLEETHQMEEVRFQNGLETLQDVLTQEIDLNRERIRLIQSETTRGIRLIALFKALGGAGQQPIDLKEEPLRPWG
jgi:NodT family efflux transporter outer membrane factor (OMF) lipoprotein